MFFSKVIVTPNRKSLRELKPILNAWFRVLESYSRKNPDRDLPWWYRERPQVGFLAAAAWRVGGGALEEWPTEKGTRGQMSYGRNDLWIYHKKAQWFIEAKHAWCDLSTKGVSPNSLSRMQSAMKAAKKAAARIVDSRGQRVAALFVSAIWKHKPSKLRNLTTVVSDWKAACEECSPEVSAFFWHAPDEKAKENHAFFGCSLLLASVD